MKTKRERLQAALAFTLGLLAPTLALASAATPVAPCVTVSSNASGVTQEFCVPVTAAAPLPVTVTGGGGGGTASDFSATFPTSGTAAGAEYLSSTPTLTSGQMVPFFVDASGNLNVNIKAGGGSGGTAIADETAFTYGTTVFTPVGGVYNSSITGLTSGQAGALALTADRNAFVNVNRWVGTQLGAPSNYGTSPGAVEVPGVNAFVTNTPAVTQSGGPWTVTGSGTAGSAASGVLSVQGIASMTPLLANPGTAANWGVGATGSAVPANGDYGTGDAQSAEPTKATTGNLTGTFLDLTGKVVTSPYANRENMVRGSASATGTGATTLIAAGGANIKTYVTDVECGRSDAGTAAIIVTLSDSASTILVLPNSGGGGGNNKTFNTPLVTAANTALTFTSGTGTTTVYCSAQGFSGY